MEEDYNELERQIRQFRDEMASLVRRLTEAERQLTAFGKVGDKLDKMYDTLIGISQEVTQTQRHASTMQLQIVSMINELGERVLDNTNTTAKTNAAVYALQRWQHEVSSGRTLNPISKVDFDSNSLSMAAEALTNAMNEEELNTFMLQNNIPASEISGKTHRARCESVIEWASNRGEFWAIVEELKAVRPKSMWPVNTGQL